jgi:hypothetical protein
MFKNAPVTPITNTPVTPFPNTPLTPIQNAHVTHITNTHVTPITNTHVSKTPLFHMFLIKKHHCNSFQINPNKILNLTHIVTSMLPHSTTYKKKEKKRKPRYHQQSQ